MTNHSAVLQRARTYAQSGLFPDMLAACQEAVDTHRNDSNVLLDTGVLLSNFGFLSSARECFERVQVLAPKDSRAILNLANLARDAGNHDESRLIYATLLERFPNNPMIRRNTLVGLEYDPMVSNIERLAQAEEWGRWAVALAGGHRSRPPPHTLQNERPLRIGYISADFCQHTVGLFVKDVFHAHDPLRVALFAYSAGQINDWVTEAIRATCQYRDVARLEDVALVTLIKQDKIDVLVDLSGHTAGSRLTVFAHRPASVQVSWLGYFASTGLPGMDYLLADPVSVPDSCRCAFTEEIVYLPESRLCFTPPVDGNSIAVSGLPAEKNGHITFGCFQTLSKLGDNVLSVWSRIMNRLPQTRLRLQNKQMSCQKTREQLRNRLAQFGIAQERVSLLGHVSRSGYLAAQA